MSHDVPEQVTAKTMRLRYAGTCRLCGHELPAGTVAIYERGTKSVRCQDCTAHGSTSLARDPVHEPTPGIEPLALDIPEPVSPSPFDIDPGHAGASARREHERRRDKREKRIRAAHPRLGALMLAVSSEPQSTKAWATGALGEERLGARLNALISPTVRVLHDRRIPRTKANIDHIVVCPSGVIVIDAKRYQGRPQLRVEGGILRPRVETLLVGRRNCEKILAGVLRQVELVQTAIDTTAHHPALPVRGMLCFVEADWPLIGGSFTTRGVEVLWPRKAAAQIQQGGRLEVADIDSIHRTIATAFPPA